jgi:hypothetical protein
LLPLRRRGMFEIELISCGSFVKCQTSNGLGRSELEVIIKVTSKSADAPPRLLHSVCPRPHFLQLLFFLLTKYGVITLCTYVRKVFRRQANGILWY